MVSYLIHEAAMATSTTLAIQRANNVKLRPISKFKSNIVFTKITRSIRNITANDFFAY